MSPIRIFPLTSSSFNPRLLPSIVTKVPPSIGPLSGLICAKKRSLKIKTNKQTKKRGESLIRARYQGPPTKPKIHKSAFHWYVCVRDPIANGAARFWWRVLFCPFRFLLLSNARLSVTRHQSDRLRGSYICYFGQYE